MVKTLKSPVKTPMSKREKPPGSVADVPDFQIPTNLPKKQRLADSAPVHIGLQLFSDNSVLCGLPGYEDKVVVMMMEHDAKPGYFFKLSEAFGNFLLHVHNEQPDFPANMDDFEMRYEMRFVMGADPPIENQRPYARGAYVKLRLVKEVIEALDSFFSWRQKHNIGGLFPDPEMMIVKGVGVALPAGSEYDCKVVIRDTADKVVQPFSPLAIPGPAWSKRHADVKLQALSEHEVQVRFEGDTLSFRSNFGALGVPGRYETPSGEPLPDDLTLQDKKKACFVRIIKKWDVGDEELHFFSP